MNTNKAGFKKNSKISVFLCIVEIILSIERVKGQYPVGILWRYECKDAYESRHELANSLETRCDVSCC